MSFYTYRLTDDHCEYLREIMAQDASTTLEAMQAKLVEFHDVHVDISTIHRRIAGFHYSFKIFKKQAAPAVTEERFAERRV